MSLPVDQGLAVLYTLVDEWMWRRSVLSLLGAAAPDPLETVMDGLVSKGRAEQVRDFVTAMGGELG